MFGNLATVAVVSFLSVSHLASSLVAHKTPPHLISPLPRSHAHVTTKPTATPTPTPLPTATPTPSPSPTPLPTATPTPTPLPVMTTTDLEILFQKYGDQYQIDKDLMKRIASCESGFNNNASNLDYVGMFQFATESWIATRQAMNEDTNPDLRRNAEEAIKTTAFKIAHGGAAAWPNCH